MHSSDEGDILDLADDEGWEDIEPDVETFRGRCLVCDKSFEAATALLLHCRDSHDLDIVKIQKDLALDFMGMVKLINYIRSEATAGKIPDVSTYATFQDERYLKPVLEDDALLYNLHDIIGQSLDYEQGGESEAFDGRDHEQGNHNEHRIRELEDKLHRSQQELEARKRELEAIKAQFGVLLSHESCEPTVSYDKTMERHVRETNNAIRSANIETSYFESYSNHEIHETMLKDTVRTDAYRNFIYENKDLFQGKVVLDVGCGTGILSMFCARAGAAKVIAVDNSDIIDFARENVYKNGMGDNIICLRGKVEEVNLPVSTVDIIVSEWMGYCLLYEAMLDSVIWARDHYLKRDGLMIPSHCTLRIAPLTDAEYIEDHIHHWKNVYGFDMVSMHKDIYNDVMVKEVEDSSVPADSTPFLRLSLKNITAEELDFEAKRFAFDLSVDIEALDGFVIWFDTFFLTEPDGQVAPDLKAEDCKREGGKSVAFTTGPYGRRTHWQQGVLLIDHRGRDSGALKKGQCIEGTVGYKKRQQDNRALDIEIQWHVRDGPEKGRQSWSMR